MLLPATKPASDESALRTLQQELLTEAERLLGPRDVAKTLCQPRFHDAGPRIWHAASGDSAWAELARSAEASWGLAVFQLAHETVHLLNPVVGYTNWLEEGVAVVFSMHALRIYGVSKDPSVEGAYALAQRMVSRLPGGVFKAGRSVRVIAGSLGAVTAIQLATLFPSTDPGELAKLAEKCVPR